MYVMALRRYETAVWRADEEARGYSEAMISEFALSTTAVSRLAR